MLYLYTQTHMHMCFGVSINSDKKIIAFTAKE